VIGPSQRLLPDNTQRIQRTDIHVAGGIRTGNPRKQEAVDVRSTRRGHWDRQRELYSTVTITCSHSGCAYFEDIIVFHAESHSPRPARILVSYSLDRL